MQSIVEELGVKERGFQERAGFVLLIVSYN